jgi:hypothetical protein
MSGRALEASLGADHCYGRPVEHPYGREPAEASAQDVGHVNALSLVGLGGWGFLPVGVRFALRR